MSQTPALDFTRIVAEFKLPGMDVATLVASQQKTIEAVARAQQLAIEGFQTVVRRQAELVRGSFEDASALLRELAQAASPEERVACQTEAVKRAVDESLAGARELGEIVARAGNEAVDVLSRRVGEGLDEMRELVQRNANAAPPHRVG
jgi:phasin family protein